MSKRPFDAKREDIAFAIQRGWQYLGKAGSGHLRFTHPLSDITLTIAATPSEWRSTANTISWIRRYTP